MEEVMPTIVRLAWAMQEVQAHGCEGRESKQLPSAFVGLKAGID